MGEDGRGKSGEVEGRRERRCLFRFWSMVIRLCLFMEFFFKKSKTKYEG